MLEKALAKVSRNTLLFEEDGSSKNLDNLESSKIFKESGSFKNFEELGYSMLKFVFVIT